MNNIIMRLISLLGFYNTTFKKSLTPVSQMWLLNRLHNGMRMQQEYAHRVMYRTFHCAGVGWGGGSIFCVLMKHHHQLFLFIGGRSFVKLQIYYGSGISQQRWDTIQSCLPPPPLEGLGTRLGTILWCIKNNRMGGGVTHEIGENIIYSKYC